MPLPIIDQRIEVADHFLTNRPGQPLADYLFVKDVTVRQGKHGPITRRKTRVVEITAATKEELAEKFVAFFEQPNLEVVPEAEWRKRD